MKRISLLLAILLVSASLLVSQVKKTGIDYQGYILIEGEDAINTNFASRATSYYFAGGRHTLQLSRDPAGRSNRYFAKYVFTNTIDREYEIWLAATPPGGRGNAYMSPISVKIDDSKPIAVDTGRVVYSDRYAAPGFYYYKIMEGNISHGQHSLQIIIDKPRALDGRFVFYLDRIMIIPKNNKTFVAMQKLPAMFPKTLQPKGRFNFRDYRRMPPPARIFAARDLKEYAMLSAWAGDFEKTVAAYKQLVRKSPNDGDAKIGYMLSQIWKGDKKGAYKYLDGLIRGPGDKNLKKTLMRFRAREATWNGEYENAENLYKKLIAMNPRDIDAIVGLGNVYNWNSKLDKAVKLYEDSIKRLGEDIAILTAVAESYEKSRMYERAIISYNRIKKRYPDDFTVYQKLAALYTRRGDTKKAKAVLAEGRKINAVKKVERGDLVQKKAVASDSIIAEFEDEVENDFLNEQKHLNLQSAYEWYSKEGKALKHFSTLASLSLFQELLEGEQENRDLLLAIAKINYLEDNTKKINKSAAPELDRIKKVLDRFDLTFEDYRKQKKALKWKFDPGNIKSRISRGLAGGHFLTRRIKASMSYLDGSAGSAQSSIMENITGKLPAREETIAPFILLENGDLPVLKQFLQRQKFPKEAAANTADLKRFIKDYPVTEKARGLSLKERMTITKLVKKAAELRQLLYEDMLFSYYMKNIDLLRRYGNYYVHLKDPNNALVIFEEVLKLQPDTIETNIQVADIYRWGRKYYSARKRYEHVLDIDPKNKKAIKGRDDCYGALAPLLDFKAEYHGEPTVRRMRATLAGEYPLFDFLKFRVHYRYGYIRDRAGFQVSTVYSSGKGKLHYHEPRAEVSFDIHKIYTTISGGYFARFYSGELKFRTMPEYNKNFILPPTHNYFGSVKWRPINIPLSLQFNYEYADLDELTQAVKMGLSYHGFNGIFDLNFNFLPFFPFDRLSLYGNADYKMVSDGNYRFKANGKLIFTILRFPFKGIRLDCGGLYIYDTSDFNAYNYIEHNEMYRKQGNVPYYSPLDYHNYGAYIEFDHRIKIKEIMQFRYNVGMNYYHTSKTENLFNPYLTLSFEMPKFSITVYGSYIYSPTYSTYGSIETKMYEINLAAQDFTAYLVQKKINKAVPFQSTDVTLSATGKFWGTYKKKVKLSKSMAKVASDKWKYSMAGDKAVLFKLLAYDSAGVTSFTLNIMTHDGKVVRKIKGAGMPPRAYRWDMKDDRKRPVKTGIYRVSLEIRTKKKQAVYSEKYSLSISK